MTDMSCESVRERIPDLVGGRIPASEASRMTAHLGVCPECAAEAELVRLLYAARPQAPEALASRVRTAVLNRRTSARRPWWGMAAAAVAVLALGIGVASRTPSETTITVPSFVAEGTAADAWITDDGMIAGAPALDGLSDDALRTLLDELGSGGTGGAA